MKKLISLMIVGTSLCVLSEGANAFCNSSKATDDNNASAKCVTDPRNGKFVANYIKNMNCAEDGTGDGQYCADAVKSKQLIEAFNKSNVIIRALRQIEKLVKNEGSRGYSTVKANLEHQLKELQAIIRGLKVGSADSSGGDAGGDSGGDAGGDSGAGDDSGN